MADYRYGNRSSSIFSDDDRDGRWQGSGEPGRWRREDYGAGGGQGRERDWDSRSHPADNRGFFDRAGDEIRSWFGDEAAERRREADARRYERDQGRDPWSGHRTNTPHTEFGRDRGSDHSNDGHAASYGGGSYRSGSDRSDYGRSRLDQNAYSQDDYGRGGFGHGGFGDDRQNDRTGTRSVVGNQRDDRQGGSHHDESYRRWRDRQIAMLDREYDDYRQQRQQQFEQDFSTFRQNRQSSLVSGGPTLGQANASEAVTMHQQADTGAGTEIDTELASSGGAGRAARN